MTKPEKPEPSAEERREEIKRSQEISEKIFDFFEKENIKPVAGFPALICALGFTIAHIVECDPTEDFEELCSDVSTEVRNYALLYQSRD